MRQEDMDCNQICDLLAAYLDGEVTPEEKAKIEEHLPGCPRCRAELESLSAMQKNLRGVFQAAAGEAAPPPQAWEKIRSGLKTTKSRRGFWPVFRISLIATASTAVVAVIVFFAVMFFNGLKSGSPPAMPATSSTPPMTTTTSATTTTTQTTVPSSTTTPAPGISPGVTFNRLPDIVRNYGEDVQVDLSFPNQAPETRIMSPFPPDISIIKLPNITPPDIVVRIYPASGANVEIPPGGTMSYTLDWDQKDDSGQQVAPGWYGVEVTVASRKATDATGGYVKGVAARILVLPPEGVMEKTIEVDQSQTAAGLPFNTGRQEELVDLTITLQRVEMNADSVGFTVMVTSPAYLPPQGPGLPNPLWMLDAYATYTVDGVVHDAGVAAMNPGENGLTLRWGTGLDKIDPIPADAKGLTFTIKKIGDWPGPWTFEVPLR